MRDSMSNGRKGKIAYALQAINIIPLFFFAIVILWLGNYIFTKAMYDEVETELSNISSNLVTMFDALYPGDYSLVGDGTYQLYKGETNLTGNHALLDQIKADTGMDITLFYQSTRILTTLTDQQDMRLVGTGAPDVVIRTVLETGEAHFYNKAMIYNTGYFSYYAPLRNTDGTVTGMLFVGKPTAAVDASVQASVFPLMIADIILLVLMFIITSLYTKHTVSDLLQLHTFLGEVSTGNLNARMDSSVLKRNDELGEIAHSALNMQRSLRSLVEQDALTSLCNRRSGDLRLRQTVADATASGKDFCIAIGDIDFFKKVNDTHGHECGDMVLKNVAQTLYEHMDGNGNASRWGGEEFLLVFENRDLEQSQKILEDILRSIRSLECNYNGQPIKITMTFGLTAGSTDNIKELLRIADEKLYAGKNTGRNRIVV